VWTIFPGDGKPLSHQEGKYHLKNNPEYFIRKWQKQNHERVLPKEIKNIKIT
jgi:hypothetical protein